MGRESSCQALFAAQHDPEVVKISAGDTDEECEGAVFGVSSQLWDFSRVSEVADAQVDRWYLQGPARLWSISIRQCYSGCQV